jgi:GAF domain-containing protein
MTGFEREGFAEHVRALLATTRDPGNLDSALQRIVDVAGDLFASDLCAILALNPVTGHPIAPLRHSGHLIGDAETISAPPAADGITSRVLQAGTVFVENIEAHPAYQRPFVTEQAIQAFAALTMKGAARNQPLAVLYIDYRTARAFGSAEQGQITLFATIAGEVLQQTWLLHRYAEVARIGKELNHELSTVEALFQQLYQLTGEILDTSHVLLLAVHYPERATLDLFTVEQGVEHQRYDDTIDGFCAQVMSDRRTLLVKHLSAERAGLATNPIPIAGTELTEEALIFVPLFVRDRALGVLSIQSQTPHNYDEEDARVLEVLGNHVALALGNIRLFDRLTQVHAIGRMLTDEFATDQTLDRLTAKIRDALRADLVSIYLYDGASFALPIRSGDMLHPAYPDAIVTRHDHAAFLALKQRQPVFASDSTMLIALLGGDPTTRRGSFETREQVRSTAALPLRVGEEALGVLFVNFRTLQRFDALQRQSIESMASYAAVALRGSQLFADQRERQLRELRILRDVDQKLAATIELQPTLQHILELTLQRIEAYKGSIFLYDRDHHVLETHAFYSPTDPDYKQTLTIRLDPPEGLVGEAFTSRDPVRVNDIPNDPEWSARYISVASDIKSELDVPMKDGDNVVGVINLEQTRVDAFSQQDEDFLVTLAGQALLAIKKAQDYEREKRLAEENWALVEISREIIAIEQLEPEVVFKQILRLALKITKAQAGTVMLYNPQRKSVEMAAGEGVRPDLRRTGHPVSKGVVGKAIRERRMINVPDVTVPPWNKIHLSFIPNVRSELVAPLIEGEYLRGAINVEALTPNQFSASDERLLKAFADQAVIVLKLARMYERFRILDETGRTLAMIANPDDIDQAYQSVLDAVLRVQPDCQVAIRRYDAAQRELRLALYRDDHAIPLTPVLSVDGGGLNALVAHIRRTFLVPDTLLPPPELPNLLYHASTVRSMLCTPLQVGPVESGDYYGNLIVLMEAPDQVLDVDKLLLEGLAQQLALTINRLEAVENQQATDVVASIGQFAMGLTHELANNIGLIMPEVKNLRLELERLDVLNEPMRRRFEKIIASQNQTVSLVKRLRTLKLANSNTPSDQIAAAELIHKIVTEYPTLPATVQIQLDIPDTLPPAFANRPQVEHIVHNLLMNAVQALEKGGVIRLRAYIVNEETRLVIEVADTGKGISEEHYNRIFDLFYTTRSEGTGFGLWSARRYARQNNGDLTFTSTVGVGSTFRLTLPVDRTNRDKP